MTGAELIAAERQRQIDQEGWDSSHDDSHRLRELTSAATAYLHAVEFKDGIVVIRENPPYPWPWDSKFWKPSNDNRKNLIKAGALIAAEIDRLNRLNGDL